MTVLEIIKRSGEFLAKKGIESPRLQSELLLAHALKIPRLKLYLDFERQLTEAELDLTRSLVMRRSSHEPLQHLLGSVSFCGFEIKVNKSALIPRPETESLAEKAWQFLNAGAAGGTAPVSFLDFGTGSGCLTVAILAKSPSATACALDVSEEALALARENADRHQLADRVRFAQSDRFGALTAGDKFDLIVSNPPYIATEEIASLAPEVRDFDPRPALDGGPDGLDFYRFLAAEAAPFLRPGGLILLEFGDGQAEAIAGLFLSHNWIVEKPEPDYSGRPRFFKARPPASGGPEAS